MLVMMMSIRMKLVIIRVMLVIRVLLRTTVTLMEMIQRIPESICCQQCVLPTEKSSYISDVFSIIHLLNSRTVKVFTSCRTAVLRLVIFTLTLAQKFEISSLKLSLINSLSFIQSITYTKWLNKKKI
jgi:hypothetical protein